MHPGVNAAGLRAAAGCDPGRDPVLGPDAGHGAQPPPRLRRLCASPWRAPRMARASQSAANAWPASLARPRGGGRGSKPRWVCILPIGICTVGDVQAQAADLQPTASRPCERLIAEARALPDDHRIAGTNRLATANVQAQPAQTLHRSSVALRRGPVARLRSIPRRNVRTDLMGRRAVGSVLVGEDRDTGDRGDRRSCRDRGRVARCRARRGTRRSSRRG